MPDPPAEAPSTIFLEGGLAIVFAITLAYAGVVFLAPGNPVQVPLGFVELLFAPGYALGAILFVRKPLLPPTAEASVSVGLSVMFNVLTGLVLVSFGLGLAVVWLAIADIAVVWVGLVVKVAWGRARGVTGVSQALSRELRLPGVGPAYRKAVYALLIASLLAFVGVVYLSVIQPPTAASTSLAIYGPSGTTSSVPKNLTTGEVGSVVLSIGDGYSGGPIVLVVNATFVGSSPSNLTPVPWALPLVISPQTTSSLPLSLSYAQQSTMTITFEFTQPSPSATQPYALTFSLQTSGGTVLQGVTLGVNVFT